MSSKNFIMPPDISKIIERIKRSRNLRSDAEVAATLDLSTQALFDHKRRGSIPFRALSVYCEQNKVSLDWLLWGEEIDLWRPGWQEMTKDKDPGLRRLIEKVERIYNEGDDPDRWMLHGLITEILEKYAMPDATKEEAAQSAQPETPKKKRKVAG